MRHYQNYSHRALTLDSTKRYLFHEMGRIDRKIRDYLLGFDTIDPGLHSSSTMIEPKATFQDTFMKEDDRDGLERVTSYYSCTHIPILFFFHGPYGTGKRITAEALCREIGSRLLLVDLKKTRIQIYWSLFSSS